MGNPTRIKRNKLVIDHSGAIRPTSGVVGRQSKFNESVELLLNKTYLRAVKRTELETGYAEETFPKECPFLLKEILDESFWPN